MISFKLGGASDVCKQGYPPTHDGNRLNTTALTSLEGHVQPNERLLTAADASWSDGQTEKVDRLIAGMLQQLVAVEMHGLNNYLPGVQ